MSEDIREKQWLRIHGNNYRGAISHGTLLRNLLFGIFIAP